MKAGSIIKSWNRGDGPRTGYYAEDQDDKVIFLRVNNLKNNTIELKNVKYIHRKIHETKLRRAQVTKGDVVFAISGTKNNLGTVSVIPNSIEEANLNSALVRLDLDDSIIDKYFFCILFSLPFIRKQIEFIGKGAAQNNLNSNEIASILIPNLSLEKQREIIDFYDLAIQQKQEKETEAKRLLESIDAYLLEKLGIELPQEKESKKVFFTSLKGIQGKRLDPFYHRAEFEELEKALKNGKYEFGKLGNSLSQISYGASVKNEYVKDASKGIPFLRISDLKRNEINVRKMVYLSKEMESKLGNCFVYENDFLISRSGTTGVVAKVDSSVEGFAYGSFMIKFVLKDNALINKDYLSYYLNTKIMQQLIERDRIGAIQGNITISTIRSFIIPLPPLEVQDEIAAYISDLRSRAKELEREAKDILKSAKKEVEKMILGE